MITNVILYISNKMIQLLDFIIEKEIYKRKLKDEVLKKRNQLRTNIAVIKKLIHE